MQKRILNASLVASKDAMLKLMQDGAKEATNAARAEIEAAVERMNEPVREARKMGVLNVVAACLTFLAAGVVVWG
jgi:ElaB/YqjD/DUF883 family membrane-anchored ribosome-binding protein